MTSSLPGIVFSFLLSFFISSFSSLFFLSLCFRNYRQVRLGPPVDVTNKRILVSKLMIPNSIRDRLRLLTNVPFGLFLHMKSRYEINHSIVWDPSPSLLFSFSSFSFQKKKKRKVKRWVKWSLLWFLMSILTLGPTKKERSDVGPKGQWT